MLPQRPPLLFVALLGLLAVVLAGLVGCAPTDSESTTPEPDGVTAIEVHDLRIRCAALEAENAALESQLADVKRQHEEMRRDRDHCKNLIKIAVERGFGGTGPCPLPTIETTVKTVNRELKYVILSVGVDERVARGYRFIISRGGRYVGEVQVDYVKPKTCSASFLMIAPGMKFEVGDLARTRL